MKKKSQKWEPGERIYVSEEGDVDLITFPDVEGYSRIFHKDMVIYVLHERIQEWVK